MESITGQSALRAARSLWRRQQRSVALVPTMGNLHAGHRALVDHAVTIADCVVVSVYVNPTQFLPGEDYQSYPRTLDADEQVLRDSGAHVLFAPETSTMYPQDASGATRVDVPALDGMLCGASRPGHFTGVATVVTKLFNLVEPEIAVFGEKDYQQLLLIRALVRDLCFPVSIVGVETVREADGLAMSSRNSYLTSDQRDKAPELYRTLCRCGEDLELGELAIAQCEQKASAALHAGGFLPDYVSIRRAEDLGDPKITDKRLVVMAAAMLGTTRLIDHVDIER
jgi:pantoate--beta-alanine ligase